MLHTLPKGTKILCPRKRHLIGTLNTGLNAGEQVGVKKVDFEPGQEKVAGELCACKICGSLYYVQRRLHTNEGWKPDDPNLEPVSRK